MIGQTGEDAPGGGGAMGLGEEGAREQERGGGRQEAAAPEPPGRGWGAATPQKDGETPHTGNPLGMQRLRAGLLWNLKIKRWD